MSKLTLAQEADRRRTFAIIAHPDAGKTTLTEHILLAGGAVRAAGAVKARGDNRRARSDWMKIEKERGISVTASVMTFEHDGKMFNLLDTPGHEDFSEDTYRTLTAADCAIMVLDAAKGIEPQTLKLFEVCRLRDIPIITFINKLDREAQDPMALLDEIANRLQLDPSPIWWPAESGNRLRGMAEVGTGRFQPYAKKVAGSDDDPDHPAALPLGDAAAFFEGAEQGDLADAGQLVAHLPGFEAQLLLVGKVLPLAAAADAEMLTEGLGAQGRFLHIADDESLHEPAAFGAYLHIHHVARHGQRHEHHHVVPASHRLAFGGERRYFEPLDQGVICFFSCHNPDFAAKIVQAGRRCKPYLQYARVPPA